MSTAVAQATLASYRSQNHTRGKRQGKSVRGLRKQAQEAQSRVRWSELLTIFRSRFEHERVRRQCDRTTPIESQLCVFEALVLHFTERHTDASNRRK